MPPADPDLVVTRSPASRASGSSRASRDAADLARVCAVLVVCDGAAELPSVLATLSAQRYAALDVVVVDNATRDGSRDLLARRVAPERLVRLKRRVGFGRAVGAALHHPAVSDADLLLLLHDDLALAPEATAVLAAAFATDPNLSIVGPKLREWSDQPTLQEVGMTVDLLGRAESLLEPGELDQGQQDGQREVLYVSTAGMMLRTDVLADVRGFDPRFPALRDDLDLCWRAWLQGHRVEVVPAAVGYHLAAASRHARPLGRGRAWEPRELAERNTMATLLKCYGLARLLWVLPLVLLVGACKVVAFLVTRRFSDALAVARAHVWNLAQLPRTLRRRRDVQRRRELADSELTRLFAPGLPRVRAYGEAAVGWVAGGGTRALLEDAELEDPDAPTRRTDDVAPLVRFVRDHPAAATGAALAVVYVVGIASLLGGGQLVGGDVAPWPASAGDFLRAAVSPWQAEPLASPAAPSPVTAVLGVVSLLGFGSQWLAQRIVVLGLLPLAWVTALRAGRLVTSRRAPRALGATLYALSPVLLGAQARGYLGVGVLAALLPALVLLAVRVVVPGARTESGWRAAALLAVATAVAVGAAPRLWPIPLLILVVAAVAAAAARRGLARVGIAALGTLGLLGPWLLGVLRQSLPPTTVGEAGALPLWRAVTVVPDVLPGLSGTAGVVVAVTAAAIATSALLLGLRRRPGVVTGFAVTLVASALAAWVVSRIGVEGLWTPALLLPSALAQAGLGVVAAREVRVGLRDYSFGVRQVAVVASVVLLVIGLVGSVVRLGTGPWSDLRRDPELLPEFVTADLDLVGPYRVLLLREVDGVVRYEVLGATGPSMVAFGATPSVRLTEAIDAAIVGVVGQADPAAGARLGALGVRYVVLAAEDAEDPVAESELPASPTADGAEPAGALTTALAAQPALLPAPTGGGRVYRVQTWVPRAAPLPTAAAAALQADDLTSVETDELVGLDQVDAASYRGPVTGGGLLLLSEADGPGWRAEAGGAVLERRDLEGGLPLAAFALPDDADEATIAYRDTGHLVGLAVQGLALLALVSLALRPPRPRRRAAAPTDRSLPGALAEAAPAPVPEPAP